MRGMSFISLVAALATRERGDVKKKRRAEAIEREMQKYIKCKLPEVHQLRCKKKKCGKTVELDGGSMQLGDFMFNSTWPHCCDDIMEIVYQ